MSPTDERVTEGTPNAPTTADPVLQELSKDSARVAVVELPARPGVFAALAADPLTVFAATMAAFTLTVSRYHCSTGEYHRLLGLLKDRSGGLFAGLARLVVGPGPFVDAIARATEPAGDHLYWFTSSWLLFLAFPVLLAKLVPGVRGADLGLGFGDVRFGLRATLALWLVMLPFVVVASFSEAFQHQYPMASGAVRSWPAFVTYEVLYLAYFVAWEFVNRGLLCVALFPKVGPAVVWLHTIPFAVMHAGKPELEAYGSIVAGVALGALAVRTGTFWYGALLHAAVALSMDLLSLAQTGRWPG